jgi:hypothetical protein
MSGDLDTEKQKVLGFLECRTSAVLHVEHHVMCFDNPSSSPVRLVVQTSAGACATVQALVVRAGQRRSTGRQLPAASGANGSALSP